MKHEEYFCDKCGISSVVDNKPFLGKSTRMFNHIRSDWDWGSTQFKYDLCEPCFKSFKKWLEIKDAK